MFKLFLKGIIFIGFSFLLAGIVRAENNQSVRGRHDQKVNSEKGSAQIKTIQKDKSETSNARDFVNMPSLREAGNSDFAPKELNVKVGGIVVWTNNDSRTHYVTTMKHNYPEQNLAEGIEEDDEEEKEEEGDDTFFSSSDINPGETFSHSFSKPGIYKYYCFTHPIEMQGVVIVWE